MKWLMSTVLIAALVAGALILYLSPGLRSKSLAWLKQKNVLVLKRAKAFQKSFPRKEDLKKAKEILFQKEEAAPTSAPDSKPAQTKGTPPSDKALLQDQISEQDRKELEKVLLKAQKVSVEKGK